MEVHHDSTATEEGQGPRRRGPKRASVSRRRAHGKENVCPHHLHHHHHHHHALDALPSGENRSPLPEGFPRVPLQDITDVLSPLKDNYGSKDQGPSSGRKKPQKKSLVAAEQAALDVTVGWVGLSRCVTQTSAQSTEEQDQGGLEVAAASAAVAASSSPSPLQYSPSKVQDDKEPQACEQERIVSRARVSVVADALAQTGSPRPLQKRRRPNAPARARSSSDDKSKTSILKLR